MTSSRCEAGRNHHRRLSVHGSGRQQAPSGACHSQSDAIKSPDALIAAISASAQLSATRVLIDPSKEPHSHIKQACVVRYENLSTVEQQMVLGSIGSLSKKTMQQVDECLKKALGL